MATLTQASHQWATRPEDERFTSLYDMMDMMDRVRATSRNVVVSSRDLEVLPVGDDHQGIAVRGVNGHEYHPTHWSFGQLAKLGECPAGFLRSLPSELAADCLNFKLRFARGAEEVGVLLHRDKQEGEVTEMSAVTGPNYGRIWNADVLKALISHVGDGVTGQWKVPGEFGRAVEVTKQNTTLYAGKQNMFIFLADESRQIEMPNRRAGQKGALSRGFFLWNSEVGDTSLGIGTFLFDYVCRNRIVWGAENWKEIRLRHTASAPDRWIEEVQPALIAYSKSSDAQVVQTVRAAQAHKIGSKAEDVDKFLRERFSLSAARSLAVQNTHRTEEGRPIETLWDAATAVTAYARAVPHQDARVELERIGGKILAMV